MSKLVKGLMSTAAVAVLLSAVGSTSDAHALTQKEYQRLASQYANYSNN
ncbi:hypothetical protein SSCHL_0341 [Staphylococcus schleiferi]|uniref:Uncharacterized protein n=1 Tax=Staphylococcus coagulans TaxID=74706 RepID=A0A9X1DTB0_9STAP|nr:MULTISPECIES: hypothetical protein [Staphylococcus]BAS45121.1 hypothetical protein SSCHL_0341 [Staphylococcus schleiferi]MBA8760699.1 hypothetical protein [Staphylococcus coagulans]MBA8762662.1 hypothetical protein [Staphylococcus coagulans]MBA8764722.1 hypothetical protein [Staphylococcus coagulans]MBA8769432.1 hypothetical protein [Staphylococcus coagulans]